MPRRRLSPIQPVNIKPSAEASFLIGRLREELQQIEVFKANLERTIEEAISRSESVIQKAANMQRGPQGPQGPRGISVRGERGPKGEKGEKGDKGDDGKTPTVDLEAIASRVISRIKTPMDGRPGKDAIFDYEEVKKRVQKELGKVKVEDIEGLNPALEKILKNHGAYLHGGGDTVAAGSNVTITTNSAGAKVINATGGSGSFSVVDISGTIDDSNVDFTSLTEPTLININGAFYQSTGGAITWTYLAGAITLSAPVGAGGSIYGIA